MRGPLRVINARAIPRPPPVHIARPELLEPLIAWIGDENGAGRLALMGRVEGDDRAGEVLLGAGASTLASDLARTARKHFEEGVLWIRVGPIARIPRLQQALGRALGFHESFASQVQGTARLRDMFTARNLLLVLDDVHTAEQVAALDVIDASVGRLLLTVADAAALTELKGERAPQVCLVPPLTDEQAISLLSARAHRDRWGRSEEERLQVEQVLALCERLPFALTLAGTLARANSWLQVLSFLAEDNCDGRVFEQLADAPGLRVLDAVYRNLDKRLKSQYRDLGVLPADEPVSAPALEVLWEREPEPTAYALRELADRGLLIDGPEDDYGLHELHRRYVCARDNDPEARHDRLAEAFVYDPYGQRRRDRSASSSLTVPQRAYWLRNAAFHLLRADRLDILRGLLSDITWLHAKLEHQGPMELAADLRLGTHASDHESDAGLARVAEAVRMACDILAADPAQLPAQLLGRLVGEPGSGSAGSIVSRLLAGARTYRDASWLRPVSPTLAAPAGVAFATTLAHSERITAVVWFVADDTEYALSGALDGSLLCWTVTGRLHARLRAAGDSGVTALAVAGGRRPVAVGTSAGTIELWNPVTGRRIRTLSDRAERLGGIGAVAFTPDGERLAIGAHSGEVGLWELLDSDRYHVLGSHSRAVTDIAITGDAERAVSSSEDGSLRVFDLRARKQVGRLWQRTKRTRSVALGPGGTRAIAVSAESRFDVWKLGESRPEYTLRCLGGKGRTVALDGDGHWALAGAESAWLAVVDVPKRAVLGRLWSHSRGVNAVALNRAGTRALTGSDDQTIKFWDLYRQAPIAQPPAHAGPVQAVRIARDGRFATSVGDLGDLAIWDLHSGARRALSPGASVRKPLAVFSADGQYALTSAGDHGLSLWRVPDAEPVAALTSERSYLLSAALAPDGTHAVAGVLAGTVYYWSRADRAVDRRWPVPKSWAIEVGATADGQRVLAHTEVGMWIWATDDGREVLAFERDSSSPGSMVLSTDERCALVSSGQNVLVFDVRTGERVRDLEGQGGHGGPISGLAVTAQRAIALSGDGRLRVWDLDSGELRHTLSGDAFGIRVLLGVGRAGRFALSQSRSGAIEVWDLVAGKRAHALPHRVQILDWAVTDGEIPRLLTAARDGNLSLWDLASGQQIAAFKADGPMRACTVSATGDRIVAGDQLGRVHILEPIAAETDEAG